MRGSEDLRAREVASRLGAPLTLLLVVAGLVLGTGATASAQVDGADGGERSYVVLYRGGVDDPGDATAARVARLGFETEHRYAGAIKGFSADLSDEQVDQLEADPAVFLVDENRPVSAAGWVPPAAGEPVPPPGIRRVLAAQGGQYVRGPSTTSVAVLDTGINLGHPDLNAVNGKDCIQGDGSSDDDHGHGTHVAGTIAAENNGFGVVGVAPGTQVIVVKVLDWGAPRAPRTSSAGSTGSRTRRRAGTSASRT